jgi:uncharacterized membrane protein
MNPWLSPFNTPIDIVSFILFVIVFPFYHTIYPLVIHYFPNRAARRRFDLFRESWIEGLIERGDIITAAQQTRNLTMVNSVLVSSCLILIGLIANILIQLPRIDAQLLERTEIINHPEIAQTKLYLLIFIIAIAFSYFMTALRHLGHFVLVVGANSSLIKEHKGSPKKYFASLISRASYRYTSGVRYLYSAIAIFGWLFDTWLFMGITLFFGMKFIFFQDFTHKVYK